MLCCSVLGQYRRTLEEWKLQYAPQTPEETLNERFVEACHRLPWAECLLDALLQGDSHERETIVQQLMADGSIQKDQSATERMEKGDTHNAQKALLCRPVTAAGPLGMTEEHQRGAVLRGISGGPPHEVHPGQAVHGGWSGGGRGGGQPADPGDGFRLRHQRTVQTGVQSARQHQTASLLAPLPIETDRIHVANGTYFMDGRFSPEKTYCNNRLAVGYLPDAPDRSGGLRFLSELLEPEDIPTLPGVPGLLACCPPLGPRRCCSSSAGRRGQKAGLAW